MKWEVVIRRHIKLGPELFGAPFKAIDSVDRFSPDPGEPDSVAEALVSIRAQQLRDGRPDFAISLRRIPVRQAILNLLARNCV